MDEFDDTLVVADQLKVFEKRWKKGTVIKQMKSKYNEKDGLAFYKNKLVSIVECKRRYRVYDSWILELPKVMHWYNNYRDLDFVYLNRTPLGDFYLDVKQLGLDKYIEDGSIKSLDGSNGIEYKVGSRTDRNRYNDYDRDWLLISNKFFKPVVK